MQEAAAPALMSQRRAARLAGVHLTTLRSWIADGVLPVREDTKQVARVDLERRLGREPITMADWDRATCAMNREAMARADQEAA